MLLDLYQQIREPWKLFKCDIQPFTYFKKRNTKMVLKGLITAYEQKEKVIAANQKGKDVDE